MLINERVQLHSFWLVVYQEERERMNNCSRPIDTFSRHCGSKTKFWAVLQTSTYSRLF